jgi:long-chain acyl-CoA synthetase
MNAAEFARESAAKYGEYTAFQYDGREWSNIEHAGYAARLAEVLRAHGVRPGDRVPVVMPNCPEVLACFQAIWKLGAVIVPTTPQLGPKEVAYVLDHSDARCVITGPDLAEKIRGAANCAPACPDVLVLGETAVPGCTNIEPAIAAASRFDTIVDRDPDDLAFLLYTSGTTGHPKGVMLTHRNIVTNHRAVAEFGRLKERSQTILVLPLSHSFGVLMMNLCSVFGCSAAVLSKFDAEMIVRAIERYRVTRFSVVPTMLVHLINLPGRESFDTSSLEIVNTGGAILPNEVRLRFEQAYRCRVLDGYGLSECAPTATSYPAWEHIRPGSIGKPIPGVTVTIQDPGGNLLGPREPGEICIQGPNVMKGYWKNEEATREALRGGWLHSGDVGFMDEDGYVYLTDRIKDLIIKGGENISPREIEDAFYDHPAIAEICVVGVPDDTYGENIVAVVALKPGEQATADELLAHAAQSITRFKLPCRIVFRDTLPRNPNGKIDRKVLRGEILQAE